MIARCFLDDLELPPQFSYRPYIPRKRATTVATANAVTIQKAKQTQIVHGDGVVAFRIVGCYPNEFKELYDLYNTDDIVVYEFAGYWGEVLEVVFQALDDPPVSGRIFDVSGQFQVVAVLSDLNPTCN